jgi:hypothetical protein
LSKASIIVVTHHRPEELMMELDGLQKACPDWCNVYIVDNDSSEEVKGIIRSWVAASHPFKAHAEFLNSNNGKATAINHIVSKEKLGDSNEALICTDPDILFQLGDIDRLATFVGGVAEVGMISMNYEGSPKVGEGMILDFMVGGQKFQVEERRDTNVAGGIFAVPGSVVRDNGNLVYQTDKVMAYWSEDFQVWSEMRKRNKVCGYLLGTLALHLGDKDIGYSRWKNHVLWTQGGSKEGYWKK